ncbi:hypothetical protein CEP49_06535 [Mergibacter septicus]|uniref:hypothetical protein n=1 Tax=Mergibacter septicus TaxID=221402 RepID=UPI00117974DD|nr:hypothetical protein [Mergibacter septicus]AWX14228.1 hypothetical protein CEP49_06535 [Mergibacter septicus]
MRSHHQGYINLFPLLFLISLLPLIFLAYQQDLSFYRTILGQRYQYLKQKHLFYQGLELATKDPAQVCQKEGKNALIYQGENTGYFVVCQKIILPASEGRLKSTIEWRLVERSLSDF